MSPDGLLTIARIPRAVLLIADPVRRQSVLRFFRVGPRKLSAPPVYVPDIYGQRSGNRRGGFDKPLGG